MIGSHTISFLTETSAKHVAFSYITEWLIVHNNIVSTHKT